MEVLVTYYRGGQYYADFAWFENWAAADRYWKRNSNVHFIETVFPTVDNWYEVAA